MKSIKPGRGPSAMNAVGGIIAGIVGVIWTISAASMGAPPAFIIFGVIFIIMAIIQGIYHAMNATGKHRMSVYDITEHEPDPLDPATRQTTKQANQMRDIQYCPYCGQHVADEAHVFCSSCGNRVREQ